MRKLENNDYILFQCKMNEDLINDKLVRKILIEEIIGEETSEEVLLTYNSFGQPQLSNGHSLSISHKNNQLILLLAKKHRIQLGCDLETIDQQLTWSLFEKHYFSPSDKENIAEYFSPNTQFGYLCLFSAQEALFKCLASTEDRKNWVIKPTLVDQQSVSWSIQDHPNIQLLTLIEESLIISLCTKSQD